QAKTLPAVQQNKVNKGPTVQPNQTNPAPVVQKNKQLKGPNLQANQPNQPPAAQLNKKNVKTFQRQHQNFHAQQNPTIASAKFNQNHRIAAAQNWNGPQYNAYRSYQSQWHDQDWWRSHHNKLSLIGGGWYYWEA